MDDNVVTTAAALTDAECLEELSDEEVMEIDDAADEDLDKEVPIPTVNEVEAALDVLQNFSLFSSIRGEEMQYLVHRFQTSLRLDQMESVKQSSILNFFQKKSKFA